MIITSWGRIPVYTPKESLIFARQGRGEFFLGETGVGHRGNMILGERPFKGGGRKLTNRLAG